VDGSVGVTVEAIYDFEDTSSPEPLERFRKRRLETKLRIPQRASHLVDFVGQTWELNLTHGIGNGKGAPASMAPDVRG